MPVTPVSSPSTSSSVWSQTSSILPAATFSNSLSCRIFSAEACRGGAPGRPCGDVRQVQRFLDCGVAAADHRHVLIAIEEAVAGRTGRHALALERFLGGQAEVLRGRAGGDDQRISGVLAVVADQPERARGQFRGVDVVEDDLGVEALGVRLHARHQVRAHQTVGVAGPVVDLGGGHQLAALVQAGDQHGLEVGARGVDGCGVAGRAGAEDQQAAVLGSAHV